MLRDSIANKKSTNRATQIPANKNWKGPRTNWPASGTSGTPQGRPKFKKQITPTSAQDKFPDLPSATCNPDAGKLWHGILPVMEWTLFVLLLLPCLLLLLLLPLDTLDCPYLLRHAPATSGAFVSLRPDVDTNTNTNCQMDEDCMWPSLQEIAKT